MAPSQPYVSVDARIASFHPESAPSSRSKSPSWPLTAKSHPNLTPAALAEAGFYYQPTSDGPDTCRCFLCGLQLGGWDDTDDPFDEHVRRIGCAWAELACAARIETRDGVYKESVSEPEQMPQSEQSTHSRLQTFGKGGVWWPHKGKGWLPTPQSLAEAGFIFTPSDNSLDAVQCPLCSYSVEGWEKKDKPFEIHQEKKPSCRFFTMRLEPPAKSKARKPARKTAAAPTPTPAASVVAPSPAPTKSRAPRKPRGTTATSASGPASAPARSARGRKKAGAESGTDALESAAESEAVEEEPAQDLPVADAKKAPERRPRATKGKKVAPSVQDTEDEEVVEVAAVEEGNEAAPIAKGRAAAKTKKPRATRVKKVVEPATEAGSEADVQSEAEEEKTPQPSKPSRKRVKGGAVTETDVDMDTDAPASAPAPTQSAKTKKADAKGSKSSRKGKTAPSEAELEPEEAAEDEADETIQVEQAPEAEPEPEALKKARGRPKKSTMPAVTSTSSRESAAVTQVAVPKLKAGRGKAKDGGGHGAETELADAMAVKSAPARLAGMDVAMDEAVTAPEPAVIGKSQSSRAAGKSKASRATTSKASRSAKADAVVETESQAEAGQGVVVDKPLPSLPALSERGSKSSQSQRLPAPPSPPSHSSHNSQGTPLSQLDRFANIPPTSPISPNAHAKSPRVRAPLPRGPGPRASATLSRAAFDDAVHAGARTAGEVLGGVTDGILARLDTDKVGAVAQTPEEAVAAPAAAPAPAVRPFAPSKEQDVLADLTEGELDMTLEDYVRGLMHAKCEQMGREGGELIERWERTGAAGRMRLEGVPARD